MIDSKELVECTKHPEMAFQNLGHLLALLDGTDESDRDFAAEVLENCGAPRAVDVAFLCDQLKSVQPPRVYWCSTLLGRLGPDGFGTSERNRVQAELCKVVSNESLELSARERAAWAIGELGGADAFCRDLLRSHIEKAPPRLKRLLETALAT